MDHYKNFVKVVIALNVFFNYYYHKQFRFTVKKIEYYILLPFQSTNSILRFAVRRDLDGLSYLSVVLQVIFRLCAILVGNYPEYKH